LAVEAARSVLADLKDLGGCCILVDNASGDSSAAILAAFAEESGGLVRFVAAPSNAGFAAGNNIGFDVADAETYLLLNSDARAKPGALSAMVRASRASRIGIVTPTILSEDGRAECSRFRRHSILSEFIDGAHSGPLTRLLRHGEVLIYPDDAASAPDWVSFAAVVLSRDAIDAAGPMDEEFFLYFEDCDYSLRIKRAGFETAFVPQAEFIHKGGGSTQFDEANSQKRRLPAYYYRARSRYFRKWHGPLGPVFANVAWLSGRLISRSRGLVGRPAPRVVENRAADIWIGWRS
jgi:GT2 family glycosyltransferase